MQRNAIVFYASFYEAVVGLDPEDFKECICAVMEYGLKGEEIEMSGIAKMFFTMAKPQIDANNKRFENGKRGGAPKKASNNQTVTKTEPKQNQDVTKTEPKEKVKDKENVKEKVKDKENLISATPVIVDGMAERSPYAPQMQDVREFFTLKNLAVDPDAFFHRYEAMGWKISGSYIRDWKQLALAWEAEEKRKRAARSTRPPVAGTGSKFADLYAREFGGGQGGN